MSDSELNEWMQVALDLVKKAGQVVREKIYQKKEIETKTSSADLVTETDKAVEELLIGELRKKYPTHRFIGEESAAAKSEYTDAPTWIIDPIDGTLNFVHGFPYVSISVALAYKKQLEIGIVYAPILEQMFTARRGKGAYLNGITKLKVSGQQDIGKALVMSEMGGDRSEEKRKILLANYTALVSKVQNLRGLGSAAINMSYVAAGWADAYYEYGIHCWDIGAGAVLVREAGGVVIDSEGGDFELMSRRMICASSEALAQRLSTELTHLTFEKEG